MKEEIQVGGDFGPSLSGLAQAEALAARSERVESHHILLVLMSHPSPAARALSAHGVTRDLLEAAIRQVVAERARDEWHELGARRVAAIERSGSVPPSRQAEQAYLVACLAGMSMGHSVAHWGHALFGLLLVPDGIAALALQAAGVNRDSVRNTLLAEMDQTSGQAE